MNESLRIFRIEYPYSEFRDEDDDDVRTIMRISVSGSMEKIILIFSGVAAVFVRIISIDIIIIIMERLYKFKSWVSF